MGAMLKRRLYGDFPDVTRDGISLIVNTVVAKVTIFDHPDKEGAPNLTESGRTYPGPILIISNITKLLNGDLPLPFRYDLDKAKSRIRCDLTPCVHLVLKVI